MEIHPLDFSRPFRERQFDSSEYGILKEGFMEEHKVFSKFLHEMNEFKGTLESAKSENVFYLAFPNKVAEFSCTMDFHTGVVGGGVDRKSCDHLDDKRKLISAPSNSPSFRYSSPFLL